MSFVFYLLISTPAGLANRSAFKRDLIIPPQVSQLALLAGPRQDNHDGRMNIDTLVQSEHCICYRDFVVLRLET